MGGRVRACALKGTKELYRSVFGSIRALGLI